MFRDQGDLATARSLLERALKLREHALGPDHPLIARILDDLAIVLRDQSEVDIATPLLERALAIRERVFGPHHPDTVATRRALAELGE